jgi:hypothetical protein
LLQILAPLLMNVSSWKPPFHMWAGYNVMGAICGTIRTACRYSRFQKGSLFVKNVNPGEAERNNKRN